MRPNEAAPNNSEKYALRLAIVGGGRICKLFLELFRSDAFPFLDIEILAVCDIDPTAEGFQLAKEIGIHTTDDYRELFKMEGLDVVVELTKSREVLLELIRLRPKGIGVLEHNIGRLIQGLFNINQRLKMAEQEAIAEKLTSRFLMQHSNERIVVLDPTFKIIEANEPYLEAVAKSEEDVIGAHCYEITHSLKAPCSISQPELGCPMIETLQTGESAQVIHEHPANGGNSTYCDMVTYPVKDQNGEIQRVVELWRDITEELSSRWDKRVTELKADLKKLVQEDRLISLGKLVASSVHEINNPIQGLLTFSHLMQEILDEKNPNTEDLAKFKDYLSLMSNELERCGEIVSGLLSFSRQTSGEFKNVDLNELIQEILSLTDHKMEMQNIKLSKKLSQYPLIIHGDTRQLQQCILNLIFNSIEAMPEGGELIVKSELVEIGSEAKLSIQDTGRGISKEDIDHIFDPFFTTKGEGKGTGLGLSIVHGIVKMHSGKIEVDSKIQEGTSFTLSFPTK